MIDQFMSLIVGAAIGAFCMKQYIAYKKRKRLERYANIVLQMMQVAVKEPTAPRMPEKEQFKIIDKWSKLKTENK